MHFSRTEIHGPSASECGQQAVSRARYAKRLRALGAALAMTVAFFGVAAQLVGLAMRGQSVMSSHMTAPIATGYARPDIVDRNGRLLAGDVAMPSLFANPSLVGDHDELIEKLRMVLPELDPDSIRGKLADRSRKFVWIKRGLSPSLAQRIHDLGVPGLQFRKELRRAYPAGRMAGHVLGHVDVDNKGLAGFERYLDENSFVDPVSSAHLSSRAPVRLSLDVGVQHALEETLSDAIVRYRAKGAGGLILDVVSGEVMAAASLPDVDPLQPLEALQPSRRDKLLASTYELGSIFKVLTVAMALDGGIAKLGSMLDVSKPLHSGRFTISDLHPYGQPLTVAEAFIRSSNIGAALLARQAGVKVQKAFFERIGLLAKMKTEAGVLAQAQQPDYWDETTGLTASYGHGVAVAPLQFAAAAAALVNGGQEVKPTFLRQQRAQVSRRQLVSGDTSRRIRRLMRRNVIDPRGTGRRADVPGYRVGGKTGTAEIARAGGYKKKSVISSFVGAFPMDEPRYLTLVMLFEPTGTPETKGHITAGLNAAPTTARLIRRAAPLLGVPSKHRNGTAG